MKILSLAQVDMSTTEAGVVHVTDLAKAMINIGHEVDVTVLSEGVPVVDRPWLKILKMPSWASFWLLKGIIYNLYSLFLVLSSYKKYELLYVRYSPNLAFASWFASFFIPVWVEINGISEAEEEHIGRRLHHAGRIYAGRFMEKLSYTTASRCIAVTPGISDHLIKYFKIPLERIRVVPNGVDIESYRPLDKVESRKELNLENDCFYFGFIGNFIAWQGIDLLLKALPKVISKHPNVRAVLIGDGERFKEYVELSKELGIEDKVVFPGYIHTEIAPKWISSFDVGVALKRPVQSGWSPLKLYSYMACGVPVLATDTTGFTFVEEQGLGLITPDGDIDAISNALERFVVEKEMTIQFGKKARKIVEENYSWEESARKTFS